MRLMPPTVDKIKKAAKRIEPYSVLTPLVESPVLNQKIEGRLLLKLETLQRTNSFKFRGAFNAISQISTDKLKNGVVAYSSGNHAQGVAAAAQIMGIPAAIVMPRDAPLNKILNTKNYGAEVITYDRYSESREALGKQIAVDRKSALIKPYDDPDIIAGQGTVGIEILSQTMKLGIEIDNLLVPCGGGGLISGIATVFSKLSPNTSIFSVEPAHYDDTARSLKRGRRVSITEQKFSVCDSLLAETPGELTFSINSHILRDGLAVTDREAKEAVRDAFNYLRVVIEPGGAVALAATLTGKIDTSNKINCVVCSGSNIDKTLFTNIINGG